MHRFLRVTTMTLALTAAAIALADSAATKDELPATSLESTQPGGDLHKGTDSNLRKEDGSEAEQSTEPPTPDVPLDLLCTTLASSAHKAGLPVSFFSNLIWQESRFVFHAVSPAGALGIAQFMPKTAAAMGLANPLNPLEALPVSARLLEDLFQRYGNLGLAAAAYNAGEARVNNWLAKKSTLPQETRNYVLAITGLPVEHWKAAERGLQSFKLPKRMPCRDHEAFADAADAIGESTPTEAAEVKAILPTKRAPRFAETSAAKGHAGKAKKLRNNERLGSTRRRNGGVKHALGQERVKATPTSEG